ncbi:MAG: DUF3488 domain-containing protein, partial [Planctomycetaceae bacterium]|nr:DUF3488 domain-containing protein [Planctomycetaceae bacterium]
MSSAVIAANSPAPILRSLQLHIAVLLAMSGVIFACAEGSPLAALAVPVAIFCLLFVDYRPLVRIDAWTANALGMFVLIAVGIEFFGDTLEARLLAFGHFLCYLSWILLLQEKKIRQFWWLCALSVLQVATSAVLTNSPWLGLALIAYVTYALFTLSLFSLYRAVNQSAGVERRAESAPGRQTTPGSISRNAVRLESAAQWITPRFMAGAAVNGILSIAMGLLIFVFTPRIWVREMESVGGAALPAARAVSGASASVNLGDLGQILESADLVMEVRFFDHRTDRLLTVEEFLAAVGADAPLFRGAVMDDYRNGRWTAIDTREFERAGRRILESGLQFYRQDVRLRPIGLAALFVPPRCITCVPRQRREEIARDSLRGTFRRDVANEVLRSESFEYQAFAVQVGQ